MINFIKKLKEIDAIVFSYPKVTASIILAITVFFAFQLPSVRMASDFADLLPQEHEYIKTHNKISETFGGANNIIVAIKVKKGTIFTNDTLNRIYRITQSIDALTGINHNLVSSLTHRNTRKIWLNEYGTMKSAPHYDPLKKGGYTDEELKVFQSEVIANPRVYGLLVSPDLTSALVRGTLNEGELNYEAIFNELQNIRVEEQTSDIEIYATGQPVLIGWVTSYVEEIVQIFLYTVLVLVVLLLNYFRRFYGVLLPVIGIVLTTVWGLGMLSLDLVTDSV